MLFNKCMNKSVKRRQVRRAELDQSQHSTGRHKTVRGLGPP